MDYNKNFTQCRDPTVEIALIMLPGKDHLKSGVFSISPLILNPGGPGGSGVSLVFRYGAQIQQVVGLEQDIVSFDPRGVGDTTPLADCYSFPAAKGMPLADQDRKTGWFNRLTWMISAQHEGLVNSTHNALQRVDARARINVAMCNKIDAINGDASILKHLSTPAVATDMISIVDAWDHWRAKTGQDVYDIDPEDKSLNTRGQLVYWGFSYGTLLGATAAAMFPDRVGRVILDAVVDADEYVTPSWDMSLQDTDASEAAFWHFCHKSGDKCALYRDGDSEADVKTRYYSILAHLRSEPVTGINTVTNTPALITADFVRMLIFQATYSPVRAFPAVAIILNWYYTQDYGNFINALPQTSNIASYLPFTGSKLPLLYRPSDANYAIMCSDKRYPLNGTLPELQERFEKLANTSSWADVWATIMIGCDGWEIKAVEPPMQWCPPRRMIGDFVSAKEKPIKTSFPVLFIGNRADPVTPLVAAVKMAGKFKDAGLIQIEIEGHSSLAQVSLCAIQKIRDYFQKGSVPPPPTINSSGQLRNWTVCQRDEEPWAPFDGNVWLNEKMLTAEAGFKKDLEAEMSVMQAWAEMNSAPDDAVGLFNSHPLMQRAVEGLGMVAALMS